MGIIDIGTICIQIQIKSSNCQSELTNIKIGIIVKKNGLAVNKCIFGCIIKIFQGPDVKLELWKYAKLRD